MVRNRAYGRFLPQVVHNEPHEDLRSDLVSIRSQWFTIVEDYTTRFMSFESDKLPALLGLARTFSKRLGNAQYAAGMFLAHMPSTLMWRVRPRHPEERDTVFSAFQPRKPMERRAPSWSWAALDGFITYDSQRLASSVGPPSIRPSIQSDFCIRARSDLEPPFQIARHPASGEDDALCFSGRVLPLRLEEVTKAGKLPFAGGSISLIDTDDKAVGAFFSDIPLEVRSENAIMCLEVRGEPYWSEMVLPEHLKVSESQLSTEEEFDKRPMIMGLGLITIAEGTGVYRRLGIVRWVVKSLFDDVGVSEITLI